MKTHSAAALLPEMSDDELRDLVADIREHGLQVPIVTLDDTVLDGRSRLKACRLAKVEPRFVKWSGTDPAAHVLSLNLHRRHLTESQRAMVAVDYEAYHAEHTRRGRPPIEEKSAPGHELVKGRALDHSAKTVGASPRSAARAKRVVRDAPDLAPKVRAGNLTVKEAEREVQHRQQVASDEAAQKLIDKAEPATRERLQQSQYVAAMTKAVAQTSSGLLTFEPERIADAIETLDVATYELFADQLEDWAQRLRRALRPLHVVKGANQ